MTMTADQKLVVRFYETFGTKCKGHLVDIVDGPVVCSFVFEPESSASVSKIIKVAKAENDVILLPHDNYMIIQMPKENKATILFSDLIKTPEYEQAKGVIPIVFGVDTTGKTVMKDLTKLPHLLVTSHINRDKSPCIELMLKSITTKMAPSDCQILIFDPLCMSYEFLKENPHLLYPLENDVNAGFKKFDTISKMIDYRYQVFVDNNVNNIAEYHEKTHRVDMPYIVIVIDELSFYTHAHKRLTEKFIKTLGSKGRAAGIHLIAATRCPTKEVLSLAIKAFFPCQICFKARNAKDSVQMFGETGAEKLQDIGDMLFSDAGRIPVRMHSVFEEY